jgi:hypothetical protein
MSTLFVTFKHLLMTTVQRKTACRGEGGSSSIYILSRVTQTHGFTDQTWNMTLIATVPWYDRIENLPLQQQWQFGHDSERTTIVISLVYQSHKTSSSSSFQYIHRLRPSPFFCTEVRSFTHTPTSSWWYANLGSSFTL